MLGNAAVASKLATLFNSEQQADCEIVFVQEKLQPSNAKRQKLQNGTSSANSAIDEPLPGHTFMLRFGSEWFRTKLDDMRGKQEKAAANTNQGHSAAAVPSPRSPADAGSGVSTSVATAASGTAEPTRPVLRVPLGGAAEVPSARAAIQYIYTGSLSVDTIRAALEVWRQAQYLQIENCAADCLQLIKSKVMAAPDGGGGGADGSGGGADGPSTSNGAAAERTGPPPPPPVLELYACGWMWRDIDAGPHLPALLASAKPLLVSHFSDTLSCLNCPSLRQQLLELPAAGLEVLLESDDFGTDTEDSVLLLLAMWMQHNRSHTDAAARERLCRLVRLAQLSSAYGNTVLPALCSQTDSWFPPVERAELSVFGTFASLTTDTARKALKKAAGQKFGTSAASYNLQSRRQCLAAATAPAAYDWTVTEEELRRALGRMRKPSDNEVVSAILTNGADCVSARGFDWSPIIWLDFGQETAGLFLDCSLPSAYQLDDTWTWGDDGNGLAAMVQLDARLEVHYWPGGVRKVATQGTFGAPSWIPIGETPGWRKAIALQPQPQQASAGSSTAGGSNPLAPWAKYLHEGKVWGRLVLLPRSA